jgi:hypothetical protein
LASGAREAKISNFLLRERKKDKKETAFHLRQASKLFFFFITAFDFILRDILTGEK